MESISLQVSEQLAYDYQSLNTINFSLSHPLTFAS